MSVMPQARFIAITAAPHLAPPLRKSAETPATAVKSTALTVSAMRVLGRPENFDLLNTSRVS